MPAKYQKKQSKEQSKAKKKAGTGANTGDDIQVSSDDEGLPPDPKVNNFVDEMVAQSGAPLLDPDELKKLSSRTGSVLKIIGKLRGFMTPELAKSASDRLVNTTANLASLEAFIADVARKNPMNRHQIALAGLTAGGEQGSALYSAAYDAAVPALQKKSSLKKTIRFTEASDSPGKEVVNDPDMQWRDRAPVTLLRSGTIKSQPIEVHSDTIDGSDRAAFFEKTLSDFPIDFRKRLKAGLKAQWVPNISDFLGIIQTSMMQAADGGLFVLSAGRRMDVDLSRVLIKKIDDFFETELPDLVMREMVSDRMVHVNLPGLVLHNAGGRITAIRIDGEDENGDRKYVFSTDKGRLVEGDVGDHDREDMVFSDLPAAIPVKIALDEYVAVAVRRLVIASHGRALRELIAKDPKHPEVPGIEKMLTAIDADSDELAGMEEDIRGRAVTADKMLIIDILKHTGGVNPTAEKELREDLALVSGAMDFGSDAVKVEVQAAKTGSGTTEISMTIGKSRVGPSGMEDAFSDPFRAAVPAVGIIHDGYRKDVLKIKKVDDAKREIVSGPTVLANQIPFIKRAAFFSAAHYQRGEPNLTEVEADFSKLAALF